MAQDLKDLFNPRFLAGLGSCRLIARTVVDGFLTGLHSSSSAGTGGEFKQYRQYVPGDDLRYMDWKLYGRTGRLSQKVFNEETEMRCAVLADASASMAYKGETAPWSKYNYAAVISACFAYLAALQGDKAELYAFSDTVKHAVSCSGRKNALPVALEGLDDVTPSGTADYSKVMQYMEHFSGRRCLFVLISDLWNKEHELERFLRRAKAAGGDCIVCHVLDRDEVELPFKGAKTFTDIETGESVTTSPELIRDEYLEKMCQYLEEVRNCCLSNQADYLLCRTDEPADACLTAFLKRRGAMVK